MRLHRVIMAGSAAGIMALVGACAREGAPPGGPVDRRPPVLVKTVPDTFAVVPDFKGPVRFVFDERISEKVSGSTLDDAVLVSPQTGNVRVSHDRQGISVTMGGGFRPDITYRITLLPVLSDLFNNRMHDPVDLVFSTGAAFNKTAVAGMVWDRVTGKGVPSALVEMTSDSDSLVYRSETDSAGVYAFRYLPAGRYGLLAFQDQNRNDRPDFSELQGRRRLLIGPTDTLIMNDSTLRPDTTPARVTDANALDSMTVVVQFDDYLDPETPTGRVTVNLMRPDSTAGPGIARVFKEAEYSAYVDQVQDSFARLDSLERAQALEARVERIKADSAKAAMDSASAPADTGRVRTDTTVAAADTGTSVVDTASARTDTAAVSARRVPPRLPGSGGGGRVGGGAQGSQQNVAPDGTPLPGRRIVAILDRPLEPSEAYTVTVTGVVNINQVPLGGGKGTVVLTPPDTAKTETTGVDSTATDSSTAADTTKAVGAPGDTARADTVPGRADTSGTAGDTTPALPSEGPERPRRRPSE